MSSLLTLAKDLEQKSKAQQQNTYEMLKAAFSAHEQRVKAELSASAKRINAAIHAHNQSMTEAMQSSRLSVLRMAGRMWLIIVTVSVLLLGTSGSVLWWQGQTIVKNMNVISQQEDTLTKLAARTWGVDYQRDSNGRFLLLPKGMKGETGWTVESGKRNAVKLVQE